MRHAIALLRSDATARAASIAFVLLVSWVIGSQAAHGLKREQWIAAAAALAGAVLVVLLVHGPSALFASRPKR